MVALPLPSGSRTRASGNQGQIVDCAGGRWRAGAVRAERVVAERVAEKTAPGEPLPLIGIARPWKPAASGVFDVL